MTVFRCTLVAFGIAIAAYGIDLLLEMSAADLKSVALWFVGGILADDLIFGPLAALLGLAGHRLLPARWWPACAVGAFVSLALVLIAVPVLGREGAVPGNDTVLDRNYTLGLCVALAVVWAGVAIHLITRREHAAAPLAPAPADL
ncbi:hypothetical protein [Nocardia yamanashiensis]|uniref:hypothetical protein n=1 Tax=Nocardia yamanashiensis TaxID=209247 RepID=UPI000836B117|nr:hypothetical protein [Nocardia yamanashiensis]